MLPPQTARSVGFRCLLLTCLAAAACSAPAPDLEPPTPTKRQLESIGDAYVRATIKLNRPPAKMEEFLPSLAEHGKPDQILRSPNDGQPFEIVWGNELRMLKATGNDVPIIAYEKVGKDGVRHVLRGRSEVLQLSESALKAGKFPPGYKFPF